MTLSNINTKERGFTIVELLIVIVVIAILAAITIVAYNGIQNRAKLAQYQSDASGIVKVAEAANAREDSPGYPANAAAFTATGVDAKLPQNVLVAATAGAATENSTGANGSPTIASSVKTYKWVTCGTAPNITGIRVYYMDPTKGGDTAAGNLKSAIAGTGC